LSLTWDYGAGSTNNGNVRSEGIVSTGGVNGTHVNVTQTFTYDSWNRLRTAVEGGNWQQQYEYDKFGNRALLSGTLSGAAPNYIPGGN
jgi:hypothetical protein